MALRASMAARGSQEADSASPSLKLLLPQPAEAMHGVGLRMSICGVLSTMCGVHYSQHTSLHACLMPKRPLCMPGRTNNKKNKREKKETGKGKQKSDGRCA